MCQKCVCSRWGSFPRPRPPIAGFKGPTFKGMGGQRRVGEERGGEGKGMERSGRGKGRGNGEGKGKGDTGTSSPDTYTGGPMV